MFFFLQLGLRLLLEFGLLLGQEYWDNRISFDTKSLKAPSLYWNNLQWSQETELPSQGIPKTEHFPRAKFTYDSS